MKTLHPTACRATALAVLSLALLILSPGPARATSATWLASPTDGNWITSASENNWSTGIGLWPGGNSTSSSDTATFNNSSAFTTITISGNWNIKNVTFDTANCAAYTINNTSSGARWTGGGAVTINSTVTQPQAITGSQLRLHTTGAINLVNNSATPTATLTVSTGFKANNSAETTTLDQAVNLQGSNPGNNTVSGAIVDYDSSIMYVSAVTKSGAGTWYLTANNTYKGPTIITGGTLVLSGSGAINSTTNIVINGTGATLSVANTINDVVANSALIVTNSGTLVITNTAFRTPVTINSVVVSNNATLRLGVNGSAPFTNIVALTGLTAGPGGILLSIDQVANVAGATTFPLISYAGADPAAGNFTVSAPAIYTAGPVTVDTVKKLVTVTLAPLAPSSLAVWVGMTNNVLIGNWDLATTNWLVSGAPGAYSQFGPVQFDDTASNSAVSLTTTLTPSLITVSNFALNYTFNGGGSLGGAASLLKQGSGTLVLDNTTANTYSGGTTIANNGVLQLGNNDAGGSLGSGPVTNNASLVVNRSDVFTLGNVISGTGTVTKSGNGTLVLSGASTYTGQTLVNSGALAVNGSLAGSVSNAAGTTLVGSGTVAGAVSVSGALNPGNDVGVARAAGTFTAQNGVALDSLATLTFDLNTATTPGGGVNDLLNITGDLTVNGNTIAVSFLSPPTLGSPYRLINFSGNLNGAFSTTVNSHYTATLDQATPNQINVTMSGSGSNLKWNSTGGTSWDNGATANWFNLGTSASDVFYAGDAVLFDDSVANVQTNVTLAAGVTVFPASLNVNSATNYFIAGGGRISGAATLTKSGNGILSLGTSNDFTGAIAIQGGTILIGNSNALGSWSGGAVTIANGGALDLGSFTNAVPQGNPLFGARQFNIAGAGPADNGALVNSGINNQLGAYQLITLTADATFGGPTRWDMRNGTVTLDLAGHKLTKTSPNQISLVSVAVTSGDMAINQGILSFESASSVPAGGTITVNAGGYLGHYRLAMGAMTRNIVLNGGGTTNLSTSGAFSTNDSPITLTANSILGGSTTATYPLYLNGVISESGSSYGVTKASAGPVVLTAVNTYSGNTIVNSGALALSGSGSIANSANITVLPGATLDASARSDATFTLGTTQTLAGGGTNNGAVIVPDSSTAVIHPGGGGATTTTLTFKNGLTFAGSGLNNVIFDLSSAYNGHNDQIVLNGAGSVLAGNSTVITINCAGLLDTAHDYVLFNVTGAGGSIAANSFAFTPAWSGTAPKYASSYSIVVSGTQVLLHFTKIPLTVTAVTDSKTYDGTNSSAGTPAITSGALDPADSVTWTQVFDNKNAGTGKTLIPSGAVSDGNGGNNYAVTFVSDTTGVIIARPITVTAATDTKPYDGSASSAGVSGITAGSLAAGDSAVWTQSFNNKNAGTGKTLNPAGVVSDGNGGLNYGVTFVPDTTGVITAKPITVTAATNSKPYDGNTSAAATPTIAPALVSGDNPNFTETYDTATVGTGKTLTPAGSVADGNSGNNYAVTFANDTTGVVTAKALTVTGLTADNKVYDGTNTATINTNGAALVGIVSGDDVILLTNGYAAEFASSGADTNIAVTVTNLTLGGLNATDYSLSQPTGLAADITPATLTVTGITAQDKVYDGGTNATLNLGGAILDGVLAVDLDNVTLDTSSAVGAFNDPAVGNNKPVTISGLAISGTAATNYSLTQPSATASITSASVPGEPRITSIGVSGGNVTVIGTNVPGSFGHTYYLVTSGSLTAPRSDWLPLATNTFAVDGGFTNTVSAGGASQFYLIQVPLP